MSTATSSRATPQRDGAVGRCGLAAAAILFAGCLTCHDADGYLVDGSDATGLTFAGVSRTDEDNTGGDDGDIVGTYFREGHCKFASAALTAADVGKAVYLLDNQTVVKSGHADLDFHIYVGRISEVLSATSCWVELRVGERDPNLVEATIEAAGVNAGALNLATAGTNLGGSGLYVKKVLAVAAYVTSTGAGATVTRKVITTHYTLAAGVITTVGDESLNTLQIALLAVVKQ